MWPANKTDKINNPNEPKRMYLPHKQNCLVLHQIRINLSYNSIRHWTKKVDLYCVDIIYELRFISIILLQI